VRAGHTYEIKETKTMSITLKDNDGKKHSLSINGNKTAHEICEKVRGKWKLEPWIVIIIVRQDGRPFFLEEGGEYNLVTQYDPDQDPRPLVIVRVDTSEKTFLTPEIRGDGTLEGFSKALSERYGFQFPKKLTQCSCAPEWPRVSGQQVKITHEVTISCESVRLETYTRRSFTLYVSDGPWETGEIILPTAFRKAQIWKHPQSLQPAVPGVSQFQIVAGRQAVSKLDKWPAGEIIAIPVAFQVV
jgi:hypothetical protein